MQQAWKASSWGIPQPHAKDTLPKHPTPFPVVHVWQTGIRVNTVAPGPIWTPLLPATFPKVGMYITPVPIAPSAPGGFLPYAGPRPVLFLTAWELNAALCIETSPGTPVSSPDSPFA
jgi:hypothetical protein